jgi:hypothetical protein
MSTLILPRRSRNRFNSYLGVLPASATALAAKRGMELADIRSLGIVPGMAGGANKQGYNTSGDILGVAADGTDLNSFWDEYNTTLQMWNAARSRLVSFLSFPVTQITENVAQITGASFEEASEFGEPRGMRPSTSYFSLGYDFKWYDLAARYTWKFLADADSGQINAIHQMALEADNRLMFQKVMAALFNKNNRLGNVNGSAVNVYALYNADGTVPPTYKTNVFDGTHTHYRTTGMSGANTAVLESVDIDAAYDDLKSHGYSFENGVRVIALMNSAEAEEARTWLRSAGDKYDFIPAVGQPGQIMDTTVQVVGQNQPPAFIEGLNCIGVYGNVFIVEEDYIPVGYVAIVASGGPDNLNNPVGIREHANASLRGLRLVKGANPDYPLIDSFYNRGFGTGIRQRGGSIILQVTSGTTYTNPTIVA